MEFINTIAWYYTTESKHGLINAALSGSILLLIGIAFLFISNSFGLLRGVSYALIMGSLIFVLGGYFAGKGAEKSKSEKVELYKSDPAKFIDTEYQKVEQIHKGWLGIRIFWTLFLVVAIAMFFFVTKPFWTGVAIGILIIGTFGHIEEVISYQHNEKYRLEVQREINNIQNNL